MEFAPRGAREWLAALFLRSVVRIAVKPVLSPRVAIPWQRWWLKRLTLLIRPRRRVDIQDHVLAGVKGEWVRGPPGECRLKRGDSYLHGGGYCVGSPATDRAVTARLARTTGLPVFVADYRLAPEHPFPAAVDDAVAAYRALLEWDRSSLRATPRRRTCIGNRARCSAIATFNPLAALVLLSPWVDLTTSMLSDQVGEA